MIMMITIINTVWQYSNSDCLRGRNSWIENDRSRFYFGYRTASRFFHLTEIFNKNKNLDSINKNKHKQPTPNQDLEVDRVNRVKDQDQDKNNNQNLNLYLNNDKNQQKLLDKIARLRSIYNSDSPIFILLWYAAE